MRSTLGSLTATLVLMLCGAPALAGNSQQERMTQCNAQASDKKLAGDERKAFMKGCLSASGAPADSAKPNSQQQKMKQCNADAQGKKLAGAERQSFMKSCLSGG